MTDDQIRTIGLTLLRSFEIALTTVAWKWERHPEMEMSQGLGESQFRYFIYPHTGDWDNGKVTKQAELFNLPMELAQAGSHTGDIPQSQSFFQLDQDDLVLSCIKMAEDRESLILRVNNPTHRDIKATLSCFKNPIAVNYTNLNEQPIEDNTLELVEKNVLFNVNAKKIVTLELLFGKENQ